MYSNKDLLDKGIIQSLLLFPNSEIRLAQITPYVFILFILEPFNPKAFFKFWSIRIGLLSKTINHSLVCFTLDSWKLNTLVKILKFDHKKV
jgi:hypothetical protein